MSGPVTRRAALRGSAAAALGLAAGVAPALATPIVASVATLDPDATLIDLAGRYARLAARDEALWVRRSMLEDRAMAATGKIPPRPEVPSRARVIRETTATEDIVIMAVNRGADAVDAALLAPWRAAVDDVERARKAMEARLGVPRLSKLIARSETRLRRWGARLTGMEPQTAAGLGAKAAALVALGDRFDGVLDAPESRLAISLCQDAVRLHGTALILIGDRHA